jgi:hypothetical protein
VVLSLDGCVISAKLHGFDNETLVVASPISIRWTDSGITTDITDDLAQLMAIPLTQVSFAGVRYEKAPAHVRPGSEAST